MVGLHYFLSRFTNIPGNNISSDMSPRKKALPFYTEAELKLIKEQWLRDKQHVDEKMKGLYHRDVDQEYEKYLNNLNLRRLFNFAVFLYRGIQDADVMLYDDEQALVSKVYGRIVENGYYDQSKTKEKDIRTRLGKAVRRQYWLRYKKR